MNTALTTMIFSSFAAVSATAMTSTFCDSCISFETHRFMGPIEIPPHFNNEASSISSRNSSAYNDIESELQFEIMAQLPAELASLIASVDKSEQKSYNDSSDVRYYATYSEDEMCASKARSKFESWEESYVSLEECCQMAFSWDVDACLSR
ncbi:hypothetical protein HJC23_008879 [Cyclotella cryptica]|uniref:Uncharacterized protein n=1 Tax=Cyclotella cryptica TaxID=29204 RepID=A0ABD3PAW1_9STRA|eukprot:CCRYP_015983-RA/>CCRYP_015983-RA protein AED:0.36 eAED:0.36 QI:0/-1/0/1/-1/1/1/0/150